VIRLFTVPRAVIGTIFFIIWTMVITTGVLIFGAFRQTQILNRLIFYWTYFPLAFYGITVRAFGLENLPRGTGGLFVFNHQSHFDILAVHRVADVTLRFGAKIELFKIPLFGHGMRIAGALPIVRDNRAEVFRVYKESEVRFNRGESFILAPEGTRQSEPKLGIFKRGPFLFAANAKAKIIPTVVVGAYEVMSKRDWLPMIGRLKATIEVHFLAPVSTLGREDDLSSLSQEVRAQMVSCFNERHRLLFPNADLAYVDLQK
jgi:1-acyl-sn-glycerol-3-phosphate acyltransferase